MAWVMKYRFFPYHNSTYGLNHFLNCLHIFIYMYIHIHNTIYTCIQKDVYICLVLPWWHRW